MLIMHVVNQRFILLVIDSGVSDIRIWLLALTQFHSLQGVVFPTEDQKVKLLYYGFNQISAIPINV